MVEVEVVDAHASNPTPPAPPQQDEEGKVKAAYEEEGEEECDVLLSGLRLASPSPSESSIDAEASSRVTSLSHNEASNLSSHAEASTLHEAAGDHRTGESSSHHKKTDEREAVVEEEGENEAMVVEDEEEYESAVEIDISCEIEGYDDNDDEPPFPSPPHYTRLGQRGGFMHMSMDPSLFSHPRPPSCVIKEIVDDEEKEADEAKGARRVDSNDHPSPPLTTTAAAVSKAAASPPSPSLPQATTQDDIEEEEGEGEEGEGSPAPTVDLCTLDQVPQEDGQAQERQAQAQAQVDVEGGENDSVGFYSARGSISGMSVTSSSRGRETDGGACGWGSSGGGGGGSDVGGATWGSSGGGGGGDAGDATLSYYAAAANRPSIDQPSLIAAVAGRQETTATSSLEAAVAAPSAAPSSSSEIQDMDSISLQRAAMQKILDACMVEIERQEEVSSEASPLKKLKLSSNSPPTSDYPISHPGASSSHMTSSSHLASMLFAASVPHEPTYTIGATPSRPSGSHSLGQSVGARKVRGSPYRNTPSPPSSATAPPPPSSPPQQQPYSGLHSTINPLFTPQPQPHPHLQPTSVTSASAPDPPALDHMSSNISPLRLNPSHQPVVLDHHPVDLDHSSPVHQHLSRQMREEEDRVNSPLPASLHDPVALIGQLQSLLEGLASQVVTHPPTHPPTQASTQASGSSSTSSSALGAISSTVDQRGDRADGGESDEEDEEALLALLRDKIASCATKLRGAHLQG